MTDREMLELAAKAAGLDDARWVEAFSATGIWSQKRFVATRNGYWNPLEKDGDAFRLMVELKLDSHFEEQERLGDEFEVIEIFGPRRDDGSQHCEAHELGDDPLAATRRAIVMAAAEIGRQMD